MRSGKVLVVGAHENPALPIIQSLARRGLEVHAASHQRVCVGFYTKYTRKTFLYVSPKVDEGLFLEHLRDYLERERFDVTFVVGEDLTFLISKNKELFASHTKIPLVGFETYLKCRDKATTMKIAKRINVPIPKTYFPEEEGLEEVARRIDYPAVIKPNRSDGARGITYPGNRQDLVQGYHQTVRTFGPCHIQEFVPHTGIQLKAELLLDASSCVTGWCAYHKIRYYPPSGGSSTLNSTVDRRDILELAARILKEIQWYGMADCDFIEDPRDGVPKLMEINPRFTRSIKICVSAGVDFPYLLYQTALGENVSPVLNYRLGTMLRYFPADLMWFLRSKDRFSAKPGFLKLMFSGLEDEVVSLKDPGPGLAYLISMAWAMLDRDQRRFRLR